MSKFNGCWSSWSKIIGCASQPKSWTGKVNSIGSVRPPILIFEDCLLEQEFHENTKEWWVVPSGFHRCSFDSGADLFNHSSRHHGCDSTTVHYRLILAESGNRCIGITSSSCVNHFNSMGSMYDLTLITVKEPRFPSVITTVSTFSESPARLPVTCVSIIVGLLLITKEVLERISSLKSWCRSTQNGSENSVTLTGKFLPFPGRVSREAFDFQSQRNPVR